MREPTIDSRTFRDAMGCFATGVTVISTCSRSGEPLGVTVNSFSSVSLDPPLILYSLARTASRFDDYVAAKSFVVNVLDEAHRPISNRFATKGVSLWDEVAYETWDTGCPVLADALAAFECATEAIHDGGDHVIIVGRVTRVHHRSGGEPLLYYRGAYGRIAAG
jgi:flavin reductase (DIM6/NTAB) family NADH-FMN oxidoreductase RutF